MAWQGSLERSWQHWHCRRRREKSCSAQWTSTYHYLTFQLTPVLHRNKDNTIQYAEWQDFLTNLEREDLNDVQSHTHYICRRGEGSHTHRYIRSLLLWRGVGCHWTKRKLARHHTSAGAWILLGSDLLLTVFISDGKFGGHGRCRQEWEARRE